MARNYWLVKQEPDDYDWSALVRDKGTAWTGIRNFQARNHLRGMKRGDRVLFYHSGAEKQIVGLARVTREAYPDPTATEGDWSAVDLEAVEPWPHPVTLAEIRRDPPLKDLLLLRQSRLSVMPLTTAQAERLLALSARPTGRPPAGG